jgi:DNA-binding response OmpR family regulator
MATRSLNVLIVEDEALISMLLEDILETLDHKVAGTAGTLDEAAAAMDRGGFDLAILDVNLGREPIWPLADRMRALGLSYIFATGMAKEDLPREHNDAGVLAKPYTMTAVEEALKSFCES